MLAGLRVAEDGKRPVLTTRGAGEKHTSDGKHSTTVSDKRAWGQTDKLSESELRAELFKAQIELERLQRAKQGGVGTSRTSEDIHDDIGNNSSFAK